MRKYKKPLKMARPDRRNLTLKINNTKAKVIIEINSTCYWLPSSFNLVSLFIAEIFLKLETLIKMLTDRRTAGQTLSILTGLLEESYH